MVQHLSLRKINILKINAFQNYFSTKSLIDSERLQRKLFKILVSFLKTSLKTYCEITVA